MINHVVIVGGGTSGWMAAIALSSHFPEKKITVIDPTAISPIGVGESVTGAVQQFVQYQPHDLDLADFYRSCDATPKVGIWYKNWRCAGDEYLTPVDSPHKFFQHNYYEDVENFYALAISDGQRIGEIQTHGKLMRAGKTDHVRQPDGTISGELSMASCHFDALKFASWLKAKSATRAQITHIDDVVDRFEQDETGFVTKIHTQGGREIEGDFFLDCTGFRRLLFAKAYAPKWTDLTAHLKVDSAIPSPVPYQPEQDIPVYTMATAMPNGWMWQVPTQSRLGTGYVFSSKYVGDEQAIAEAREAGLAITDDPTIIRFQPGKFESQWQGNVCAIGLAGGFLEPLEATTIHIMHVQIKVLTELFLPFFRRESAQPLSRKFNKMMEIMYGDYVDFVSFHYHSGRSDTEFWRDYQKEQSITDANLLRREKWAHSFPAREDFAGDFTHRVFLTSGIVVWMPMLCGLGLLDRQHARIQLANTKFMDRAVQNATEYVRVSDFVLQNALTSNEAIRYLRGEWDQGPVYVGAGM
ncbi:MAG: tryptophan halogenase family protein [Pirellulales bacterium]